MEFVLFKKGVYRVVGQRSECGVDEVELAPFDVRATADCMDKGNLWVPAGTAKKIEDPEQLRKLLFPEGGVRTWNDGKFQEVLSNGQG